MHISRVGFPKQDRVDSDHVSEVYLCALVAADPKTGTCYNTELKLCSEGEEEC